MNRKALLTGLTLIAFPLLVQVPFSLLAAKFSYPDILSRPAGEVLTRFHDGGSAMIWTWYAYALCTIGLALAVTMLPDALGHKGTVARMSVITGVTAAVVQMLGLLRWTMVVPFIATRWVEQPEQRPNLELAYEVQHRLFGVMIGEHVGQLFMGLWTALASAMLIQAGRSKIVASIGFVSTFLFITGMGAQLARAISMPALVLHLPMLAFVTWSVWAIAAGVSVLRSSSQQPLERALLGGQPPVAQHS